MSNGVYPLGAPVATEEASLFASIMDGDEPDQGAQDQHDDGEQGDGDGGDAEGHGETEAERQDRERDAQGRFARPEPKGEGKPPQGQDRAQKGLRNEVTSERSRRQAAEAKSAETERQLGDMRAQLDLLTRQQVIGQRQQVQAEPQKQEAKAPDRYTEPEAYDAYLVAQTERRIMGQIQEREAQRLRYSFEDAGQRHGGAFQVAYRTLDALPPDPANIAILTRIKAAADPGEALVNWHRAYQARQEIGADPVAYRERVKAEVADPQTLMQDPAFAQAVMEHIRQQASQGGPNGGPRTTYTPIPSLNGRRGSNARTASPDDYDSSDRGIFESVMRGR